MAAAILAIKKKQERRKANKAKQGDEAGRGAPATASDEDERGMEAWVTESRAGLAWSRFWSQTDLDERFWSYQSLASAIYWGNYCQVSVACLIVGNFLCTIFQMTADPRELWYSDEMYYISCFFNVCFLFELILNLYGHWFWKFWWSPGCTWNWFDAFVVTLGMLDVLKTPMPGFLSLLRNMRAFRVFRLFKRIKALNQILKALGRAVAGVSSAFVVITIVMSIYAILGVAFFKDIGINGTITIEYGDYDGWHAHEIDGYSSRGIPFGEEYFGNFARALFTMFQMLLGDSWSEVVGRILLWAQNGDYPLMGSFLGVLYLVTFMIVNAVILTNVVVAVLLEKVIDDGGEEDEMTPPLAVEGEGEGEGEGRRVGGIDAASPVPPDATVGSAAKHEEHDKKNRKKSKRGSSHGSGSVAQVAPLVVMDPVSSFGAPSTLVEMLAGLTSDVGEMSRQLTAVQSEMAEMRHEQQLEQQKLTGKMDQLLSTR